MLRLGRQLLATLLCVALVGVVAQYEQEQPTEELVNQYEEPQQPAVEETPIVAPEGEGEVEASLEDRPTERFEDCYDANNKPQYCTPPMINVAHNSKVVASETCQGEEEYCVAIGHPTANVSFDDPDPSSQQCSKCLDKFDIYQAIDYNNPLAGQYGIPSINDWWHSDTLYERMQIDRAAGVAEPRPDVDRIVNITLDFGKLVQITYIRVRFVYNRPESFVVLRRRGPNQEFIPYEFNSETCMETFGMTPMHRSSDDDTEDTQEPQVKCVDLYTDAIATSFGGDYVFSTLRAGQPIQDLIDPEALVNSKSLERARQEWMRADAIRIMLRRIYTMGDEMYLDPYVLKSYFYSISDISIGGTCECYGHGSDCLVSFSDVDHISLNVPAGTAEHKTFHNAVKEGNLTIWCKCQHNTDGKDCERCLPGFNDVPWRPATGNDPFECKPCQCNNKSEECDFSWERYIKSGNRSGSVCKNCRENRAGANCELCRPGYKMEYGNCVPCECDPIGAINGTATVCDMNGNCPCKPGVRGPKCNQCDKGYRSLSSRGCRVCRCDPIGTRIAFENETRTLYECDPRRGNCSCKPNVSPLDGQCKSCKPGYFGLSKTDPVGCQQCFCYNHTSQCGETNAFQAAAIVWSAAVNGTAGNWSLVEGRMRYAVNLTERSNRTYITLPDDLQRTSKTLYYELPLAFSGNLLSSYGENITINFIIHMRTREDWSGAVSKILANADDHLSLIAASKDSSRRAISLKYTDQGHGQAMLAARETNEFRGGFAVRATYRINENSEYYEWKPKGVTTPQFFQVLDNVAVIRLRATFPGIWISIENFTLGTVQPTPANAPDAAPNDPRERIQAKCKCPTGHIGIRCESCESGYFRADPALGAYSKCKPCECNGHALLCEQTSGNCSCMHNTTGTRCERCTDGYYGNAMRGTPEDCKKCPCPLDGPCVEIDGLITCTLCPPTRTGARCEFCEEGFFGDALRDDCKPCNCNNNTDANSIDVCDQRNGKCTACGYGTTGDACERCAVGYYGNATNVNVEPPKRCLACSCNTTGTRRPSSWTEGMLLPCNEAGYCDCQVGFEGKQCGIVKPGFFVKPEGELAGVVGTVGVIGARPCACSLIGSVSQECDKVTGQCKCKEGVSTRDCSQCRPDYYRFTPTGCTPCNCDRDGATNVTCDESGQCSCKPNVVGKRCDRCEELLHNLSAGCLPCEQCYKVIQKRTIKYGNSITEVQKSLLELTETLKATGPAELQQFQEKLTQTEERVRNMVWYVGNISKDASTATDKTLEKTILDVLIELEDLQTAGSSLITVVNKTITDHGWTILYSNVSTITELLAAQQNEVAEKFGQTLEDITRRLEFDFANSAQTVDESVDMAGLQADMQTLLNQLDQMRGYFQAANRLFNKIEAQVAQFYNYRSQFLAWYEPTSALQRETKQIPDGREGPLADAQQVEARQLRARLVNIQKDLESNKTASKSFMNADATAANAEISTLLKNGMAAYTAAESKREELAQIMNETTSLLYQNEAAQRKCSDLQREEKDVMAELTPKDVAISEVRAKMDNYQEEAQRCIREIDSITTSAETEINSLKSANDKLTATLETAAKSNTSWSQLKGDLETLESDMKVARKVIDEAHVNTSDLQSESRQLRRLVRSNLEAINRTQSMHQTATTKSNEIFNELVRLNEQATQPTLLTVAATELLDNLTRLIESFSATEEDITNNLRTLETVNALYMKAWEELNKDPDDPVVENKEHSEMLKNMWSEINDTVHSAEFLDVITRLENVEREKVVTVQLLDDSIRQLEREYEVMSSAMLEAESQSDYQRCLEIRHIQDTNEIMSKRRFLR